MVRALQVDDTAYGTSPDTDKRWSRRRQHRDIEHNHTPDKDFGCRSETARIITTATHTHASKKPGCLGNLLSRLTLEEIALFERPPLYWNDAISFS